MDFLDAEAYINSFIENNAEFYAEKEKMEFAIDEIDNLPLEEDQKGIIKKALLLMARYEDTRSRLFYRHGQAHIIQLLASTNAIRMPDPED